MWYIQLWRYFLEQHRFFLAFSIFSSVSFEYRDVFYTFARENSIYSIFVLLKLKRLETFIHYHESATKSLSNFFMLLKFQFPLNFLSLIRECFGIFNKNRFSDFLVIETMSVVLSSSLDPNSLLLMPSKSRLSFSNSSARENENELTTTLRLNHSNSGRAPHDSQLFLSDVHKQY